VPNFPELDPPPALEPPPGIPHRKPTPRELQYAAGVALGLGLGIFLGLRLAKYLNAATTPHPAAWPDPEKAQATTDRLTFVQPAPCAECAQREEAAHAANLAVLRQEVAAAAAAAGVTLPTGELTLSDVLKIDQAIKAQAEPAATIIPGEAPPIHDVPE
jgi:hypothetical protein